MNLTLILALLATLAASIPADGPSFTDICKPTPTHSHLRTNILTRPDNPQCYKDTDCGTGCCYNGLCLAYCLHNEDDVHTELVRSFIDGRPPPLPPPLIYTTLPTHKNTSRIPPPHRRRHGHHRPGMPHEQRLRERVLLPRSLSRVLSE